MSSYLLIQGKDKEQAATTIQAGYRGYRDRQRVKSLRENKEEAKSEVVFA